MNILLNSPDPGLPGGVAEYCSIIKNHFKENVNYFIVGRRNVNDGAINQISTSVKDYRSFLGLLNNIDLVHINPSLKARAIIRDGIFILLAKMCKKKVIVYFHGWNEDCERKIRRYFLALFRFVYFRVDAIIVLASIYKEKLLEMGYCKEIYIETTSVNNEIFLYCKTALISRMKLSRKGINILFLSRIEKEKGIYEAIDSYCILKLQCPQAVLNVVGDGSELKRVRKYVDNKEISDIYFSGYLSGLEKQKAFIEADVYLFPTWREGLPISILEAMVYGLPVLTRPVGGIPDFFEDGKMGFLLESKDPAIWAEKLEKLAREKELILSIGEYNYQYALLHFRPDIVVNRLEVIYNKVMTADVT